MGFDEHEVNDALRQVANILRARKVPAKRDAIKRILIEHYNDDGKIPEEDVRIPDDAIGEIANSLESAYKDHQTQKRNIIPSEEPESEGPAPEGEIPAEKISGRVPTEDEWNALFQDKIFPLTEEIDTIRRGDQAAVEGLMKRGRAVWQSVADLSEEHKATVREELNKLITLGGVTRIFVDPEPVKQDAKPFNVYDEILGGLEGSRGDLGFMNFLIQDGPLSSVVKGYDPREMPPSELERVQTILSTYGEEALRTQYNTFLESQRTQDEPADGESEFSTRVDALFEGKPVADPEDKRNITQDPIRIEKPAEEAAAKPVAEATAESAEGISELKGILEREMEGLGTSEAADGAEQTPKAKAPVEEAPAQTEETRPEEPAKKPKTAVYTRAEEAPVGDEETQPRAAGSLEKTVAKEAGQAQTPAAETPAPVKEAGQEPAVMSGGEAITYILNKITERDLAPRGKDMTDSLRKRIMSSLEKWGITPGVDQVPEDKVARAVQKIGFKPTIRKAETDEKAVATAEDHYKRIKELDAQMDNVGTLDGLRAIQSEYAAILEGAKDGKGNVPKKLNEMLTQSGTKFKSRTQILKKAGAEASAQAEPAPIDYIPLSEVVLDRLPSYADKPELVEFFVQKVMEAEGLDEPKIPAGDKDLREKLNMMAFAHNSTWEVQFEQQQEAVGDAEPTQKPKTWSEALETGKPAAEETPVEEPAPAEEEQSLERLFEQYRTEITDLDKGIPGIASLEGLGDYTDKYSAILLKSDVKLTEAQRHVIEQMLDKSNEALLKKHDQLEKAEETAAPAKEPVDSIREVGLSDYEANARAFLKGLQSGDSKKHGKKEETVRALETVVERIRVLDPKSRVIAEAEDYLEKQRAAAAARKPEPSGLDWTGLDKDEEAPAKAEAAAPEKVDKGSTLANLLEKGQGKDDGEAAEPKAPVVDLPPALGPEAPVVPLPDPTKRKAKYLSQAQIDTLARYGIKNLTEESTPNHIISAVETRFEALIKVLEEAQKGQPEDAEKTRAIAESTAYKIFEKCREIYSKAEGTVPPEDTAHLEELEKQLLTAADVVDPSKELRTKFNVKLRALTKAKGEERQLKKSIADLKTSEESLQETIRQYKIDEREMVSEFILRYSSIDTIKDARNHDELEEGLRQHIVTLTAEIKGTEKMFADLKLKYSGRAGVEGAKDLPELLSTLESVWDSLDPEERQKAEKLQEDIQKAREEQEALLTNPAFVKKVGEAVGKELKPEEVPAALLEYVAELEGDIEGLKLELDIYKPPKFDIADDTKELTARIKREQTARYTNERVEAEFMTVESAVEKFYDMFGVIELREEGGPERTVTTRMTEVDLIEYLQDHIMTAEVLRKKKEKEEIAEGDLREDQRQPVMDAKERIRKNGLISVKHRGDTVRYMIRITDAKKCLEDFNEKDKLRVVILKGRDREILRREEVEAYVNQVDRLAGDIACVYKRKDGQEITPIFIRNKFEYTEAHDQLKNILDEIEVYRMINLNPDEYGLEKIARAPAQQQPADVLRGHYHPATPVADPAKPKRLYKWLKRAAVTAVVVPVLAGAFTLGAYIFNPEKTTSTGRDIRNKAVGLYDNAGYIWSAFKLRYSGSGTSEDKPADYKGEAKAPEVKKEEEKPGYDAKSGKGEAKAETPADKKEEKPKEDLEAKTEGVEVKKPTPTIKPEEPKPEYDAAKAKAREDALKKLYAGLSSLDKSLGNAPKK